MMDVEEYDTIEEFAETTVRDLNTTIMNVDKISWHNSASTRIYFPPTCIQGWKYYESI